MINVLLSPARFRPDMTEQLLTGTLTIVQSCGNTLVLRAGFAF